MTYMIDTCTIKHYKVTMSEQVGTHPDMTLGVARTQNNNKQITELATAPSTLPEAT